MKTNSVLIIVACTGFFSGCAATVPNELISAREAYMRASTGPAAQAAPAELHVANEALAQAEHSFNENGDSYQTRDLAYVAERKSELAEATASIVIEQKNQARAGNDYQETQSAIITGMTAERLSTEKDARIAADKRAADAQAALAKLAAVKEDARGTVITLSGSVLFASNQAVLLPEARSRLDQVVAVLLSNRERNLTVEGHTDSQGSDGYNLDLSQRRADSVRNYLVQQGYEADRIQAHGVGEAQPVANNASAEGRANNRRVEIIIERESRASN